MNGKESEPRARDLEGKYSFTLKDPPDVSFAVQDANDVDNVALQSVINPNRFKSGDGP